MLAFWHENKFYVKTSFRHCMMWLAYPPLFLLYSFGYISSIIVESFSAGYNQASEDFK